VSRYPLESPESSVISRRDSARCGPNRTPTTRDSHQAFYGSLIGVDVTWNKNLTEGVGIEWVTQNITLLWNYFM